MSLAPLHPINDKQLNTRSKVFNTPVKQSVTRPTTQTNNVDHDKENNQHNAIPTTNKNKRVMTEQHEPKKKKEKLSSLCKLSLIHI